MEGEDQGAQGLVEWGRGGVCHGKSFWVWALGRAFSQPQPWG